MPNLTSIRLQKVPWESVGLKAISHVFRDFFSVQGVIEAHKRLYATNEQRRTGEKDQKQDNMITSDRLLAVRRP